MASNQDPGSPAGAQPQQQQETPRVAARLERAAAIAQAKSLEDQWDDKVNTWARETLWKFCKIIHKSKWKAGGQIHSQLVILLDQFIAGLDDQSHKTYEKAGINKAKESFCSIRGTACLNIVNKMLRK